MASLENGDSNKQANAGSLQNGINCSGDEICIMDYLFVLWKHKWLILICSILPVLIVGSYIYFSPRKYEVTYVYDANILDLNEKKYNILLSKFYDEDNLNKIIKELQKNKLDKYAQRVKGFSADDSQKFVTLEVVPPLPDFAKLDERDPVRLIELKNAIASFLRVTITGESRKNLSKIGRVIRDNIEKTMPICLIERELMSEINGYRSQMADIEGARFTTDLLLKKNKDVLAKLKKIKTDGPDKSDGKIMLQFDVGGQSEYLPIGYQICAAEAKIIELEVSIEISRAKYNYYKDLLSLYEKLSNEIKSNASSNYTIEQYYSFLTKLYPEYKNKEIENHLASYMTRMENRISGNAPVSENPKMSAIARGTIKKSAVVFVLALLMSIFASFLLEGVKNKKRQTQAS